MRIYWATIAACVFALNASAQSLSLERLEDADAAMESLETIDLKRYHVEIILFRNLDPARGSPEDFEVPIEIPLGSPELADDQYAESPPGENEIPEFTDIEPAPADEFAEDEVPVPPGFYELNNELFPVFESVPAAAFRLQDVADRLEKHEDYEPVLHLAWTQYGYSREEAVPYATAEMPGYVEGLDGSFTLSVGRFVHLELDLTLEPGQGGYGESHAEDPYASESYYDPYSVPFYFDSDDGEPRTKTLYVIKEDRIIRQNEIHYYDHPEFGVVALIVEDEPPEEELADEDFLEPQGP